MLASTEGVLCEPASAASVAGLIQAHNDGLVKQGTDIVCVLTGNGLKDPDNAIKFSNSDVKKTSSDLNEIIKIIQKIFATIAKNNDKINVNTKADIMLLFN